MDSATIIITAMKVTTTIMITTMTMKCMTMKEKKVMTMKEKNQKKGRKPMVSYT